MDPERAELRNRVSRYNQSCGPANSHATFPYTNQEYEYKNDGRYSEIQRRRLLSFPCDNGRSLMLFRGMIPTGIPSVVDTLGPSAPWTTATTPTGGRRPDSPCASSWRSCPGWFWNGTRRYRIALTSGGSAVTARTHLQGSATLLDGWQGHRSPPCADGPVIVG